MADFLDEKRSEIAARLKELKPLVDEYARLEAADAALAGVSAPAAAPAPSRRSGARRRAAAKSTSRSRAAAKVNGRGRPKGSGSRGNEALALVKATPGITIPEIAEQMGIKQNYLHRVLPGLASDGLVEKDGRGWRPKAVA